MTDTVKKLAPVIWDQIQSSQKILLHCHPNPDGDSAGSALGMLHALRSLGKQVTLISGDSPPLYSLRHLPGFDQILPKNFLEIDLTQFDLFIILDSSSLSQISRLGPVVIPDSLRTVIIDHHNSNTQFASVNLIDSSYPAVGQLVFDLLDTWQVKLTPEISICLFLAIYTDTGGFKYAGTTADTFSIAAKLVSLYPNFASAISVMENSHSPQTLKYISLCLDQIKTYFSGQVAVSSVSFSELQAHGIEKSNIDNVTISETMRTVKDWQILASLREDSPGVVSISLRTQDAQKYDVSKIAVATGYGGGHIAAAGASLKMSVNEAEQLLLTTIGKVYPDLGSP